MPRFVQLLTHPDQQIQFEVFSSLICFLSPIVFFFPISFLVHLLTLSLYSPLGPSQTLRVEHLSKPSLLYTAVPSLTSSPSSPPHPTMSVTRPCGLLVTLLVMVLSAATTCSSAECCQPSCKYSQRTPPSQSSATPLGHSPTFAVASLLLISSRYGHCFN